MTHRVAVIAGDGAGPEVIAEARKAVDALGLAIEWAELPWGTAHYHAHGAMMPPDALDQLAAGIVELRPGPAAGILAAAELARAQLDALTDDALVVDDQLAPDDVPPETT